MRTPPVGIIKSIANTINAARKNSNAIPRNVTDHSADGLDPRRWVTLSILITAVVLIAVDIPDILLPQTLIGGTQSFSLLGIPFFMLAGELMTAGGLSRRLVGVADVFVRHLPGGMGHVTILAAVIFAAISGSAPATTAAIGAIMIPAMIERGYDAGYATALSVSAGVLAPLIPPSIAFVIWGVIAEQSIAKLFLSGVVPGLVMDGAAMNFRKCPPATRAPTADSNHAAAQAPANSRTIASPPVSRPARRSGASGPRPPSRVSAFFPPVIISETAS